ncbi:MAG: RNA-binding S4 domain-containing protein [Clostridia bacterium]|nr:RNA-binding S4 domain-containing protein [Clostridia bacterium]
MKEVKIYTEFIKLDDFLKFAGVSGTGGMAKAVIQDGLVTVDGEVCTMRGKKLRGGEVVSFNGETVKVTK